MSDGYGTPTERYKELSALYDDLFPFDDDAATAVSFLCDVARGGRVLELAVGTGRIAIPLAESGCDVTGVDASPEMLDLLKRKDTRGKVRAVESDMVNPAVTGDFDLVYIVASSLFELRTQEQQVTCLKSAARLLRDGGSLVVEGALPNMLFADRRPLFVGQFDALDAVTMQAMRYDPVNQIVQYRHVFIAKDSIRVMPTTHRFVYLPELDLMAALGGLALSERYCDWAARNFDPAVGRHVSVYRKKSAEN